MPPALRSYLAREYGGTLPFVYHLGHLGAYAFGFYRVPAPLQFTPDARVIFVCKGNICRSPYAEAKARQLGLNAVSGGLDTTPGKPANPTAVAVAAARGVDLSTHRTRRLDEIGCHEGDLMLAMEPSQLRAAATMTGLPANRFLLLGALFLPRRPFLQDPFGRSEHYFERCYDLIDGAVTTLRDRLAGPAKA